MGFCGNGKDKQRYAECLLRMATVLSALGRDKEAGEYFQRYITEHDELLEAKNAEALKVMEYRFGTEEKEEVIQLQAQQISSDRAKKIAMLMIALLSLLVAALLFRNNRHFRVVNAQQRQLHEREVNDLLHQQEIRALDAMLEGQETERKRIAQELHDRLGTMLSAIKL